MTNSYVSEDFMNLTSMFTTRSMAHLVPYLCVFLSSISSLAKSFAKYQFLFILYCLNRYPESFIIRCHSTPPESLQWHFNYLQALNFAHHIANLQSFNEKQLGTFRQNLHTWQMFLEPELYTKLSQHVNILYQAVYNNSKHHYHNRLLWILNKPVRKKECTNNLNPHLRTFPFFDVTSPPPIPKLSKDIISTSSNTVDIPNSVNLKEKWFINLSSKTLSKDEISTLQFGFKFAIPDPHFAGMDFMPVIEQVISKIPNPIDKNCTRSKLTNIINKHMNNSMKHKQHPYHNTISNIRKDKTVILVNADKGNSLVLLNRSEYDNKMLAYLSDTNIFSLCKTDPTHSIIKSINQTLDNLKQTQLITNDMHTKCKPHTNNTSPTMFAQIKLHKDNKPLRPILNAKNSPTKPLANFLLTIFNLFIPHCRTSLNNTSDLIDRLTHTKIQHHSKLASFDIINMYNSIPHDLLRTAIKFFIDTYNIILPIGESTLMDLTNLVINNSFCRFKNSFYKQISGLAMGSSLSPILANITMTYIEINHIFTQTTHIHCWYRYVDDIFIIWNSTYRHLTQYLDTINKIHKSIKFTVETETNNSLNFMDITIFKDNNNLCTKIYRKNTFSGKYLNYNSCHPTSTKVGIATNLFRRAIEYTTHRHHLTQEINYIKDILTLNNYPDNIIKKAYNKAKYHTPQPNFNRDKDWLTINYIPKLSEQLGRILKNLGYNISFKPIHTIANRYYNNHNMHHKSINPVNHSGCVYKLICECGDFYIGETKRKLATRIKEHKKWTDEQYRHQPDLQFKSAVAHHSRQTGHRILWDMPEILTYENVNYLRKIKEAYYIQRLNPKMNLSRGLVIPDQWGFILKKDLSI